MPQSGAGTDCSRHDINCPTAPLAAATLCLLSATQGAGGAIFLLGAQQSILRQAYISGSQFTSNTAQGGSGGGAINSYQSDLTIATCTFTSNSFLSSVGHGGAIAVEGDGGTITVSNSQATSNEVGNGAGGFLALSDVKSASITGCTLTSNKARNAQGGAVALLSVASDLGSSDTVTISTTTFDSNIAEHGGGFAEVQSMDAVSMIAPTLDDCVFTSNDASNGGGGAVFHINSAPELTCNTLGVASSSPAVQCTGTQSNVAGARPTPEHTLHARCS